MMFQESTVESTPLTSSPTAEERLTAHLRSLFSSPTQPFKKWWDEQKMQLIRLFIGEFPAHQTLLGSSVVDLTLKTILEKVKNQDATNPLKQSIDSHRTDCSQLSPQEILNIVVPFVMKRIVESAKEELASSPPFCLDDPGCCGADSCSQKALMVKELDHGLNKLLSKYHGDQSYLGWTFGRAQRNPLRSLAALLIVGGVVWNLLLNFAPELKQYQDTGWIRYPTIAFGLGILLVCCLGFANRSARFLQHRQLNATGLFLSAQPHGAGEDARRPAPV